MIYRKMAVYGIVFTLFLSMIIFQQKGMAQTDEAFIILSSEDAQGMNEAVAFIEEKGGRIIHKFPFHVLIGIVPPAVAGEIIGQKNILHVEYGTIDVSLVSSYGDAAIAAANFWNSRFQAQEQAPQQAGSPLINDALIRSTKGETQVLSQQVAGFIGPPYGTASGADFYDTSEYMIGTVSVNVILPESTGTGNENWDSTRENQVTTEVMAALD